MGVHKEDNIGAIVDFTGYRDQRKASIDEWLDNQVAEHYRDIDIADVKNPTLRLMTLYDVLEGEKKSDFYGYVRRIAENKLGERIRREQFWALMTAVSDAWKDMEEYGKKLIIKDSPCLMGGFIERTINPPSRKSLG